MTDSHAIADDAQARRQRPDGLPDGGSARVLVVDADRLVRSAASEAIAADRSLVVVGVAASAEDAMRQVGSGLQPEIVVVDPDMTEDLAHGLITALSGGCAPPLVLAFSHATDEATLVGCLRAGASGFVGKHQGIDVLVASIHALLRGEVALSRTDMMRVADVVRRGRRRRAM